MPRAGIRRRVHRGKKAGATRMTRSHALLMLATIVVATTLAFGQGQAYHPLGIDLSGYWSQFARQQDAGLGTAAGDLGDYGGVSISEAGRPHRLARRGPPLAPAAQTGGGPRPP